MTSPNDLGIYTAVLDFPRSRRPVIAPAERHHALRLRREHAGQFYCGLLLGGCGERLLLKAGEIRAPHFSHRPHDATEPLTCRRMSSSRHRGRQSANHLHIATALDTWLQKLGHSVAAVDFGMREKDGHCTDMRIRVGDHGVIEVILSGTDVNNWLNRVQQRWSDKTTLISIGGVRLPPNIARYRRDQILQLRFDEVDDYDSYTIGMERPGLPTRRFGLGECQYRNEGVRTPLGSIPEPAGTHITTSATDSRPHGEAKTAPPDTDKVGSERSSIPSVPKQRQMGPYVHVVGFGRFPTKRFASELVAIATYLQSGGKSATRDRARKYRHMAASLLEARNDVWITDTVQLGQDIRAYRTPTDRRRIPPQKPARTTKPRPLEPKSARRKATRTRDAASPPATHAQKTQLPQSADRQPPRRGTNGRRTEQHRPSEIVTPPRITLRRPRDFYERNIISRIPGAMYNKSNREWSVPGNTSAALIQPWIKR